MVNGSSSTGTSSGAAIRWSTWSSCSGACRARSATSSGSAPTRRCAGGWASAQPLRRSRREEQEKLGYPGLLRADRDDPRGLLLVRLVEAGRAEDAIRDEDASIGGEVEVVRDLEAHGPGPGP